MFYSRKTIPIFVLGCQRSGTTMLLDALGRSRYAETISEADRRAMTEGWRLREDAVISDLISRLRKKITAFKPLNDSQSALRLLQNFPGAKAVWIVRNPYDTANSAVNKWGSSQLDMMTWIASVIREAGSLEAAQSELATRPSYATYAERLAPDVVDDLLDWTQQPLSAHAGAAILWFLRNRFFFDLGLADDERVMLMSYEEFVNNPERSMRRVCDFVGIPYSDSLVGEVHSTSVGKSPPAELPDDVREAVLSLMVQFESCFHG